LLVLPKAYKEISVGDAMLPSEATACISGNPPALGSKPMITRVFADLPRLAAPLLDQRMPGKGAGRVEFAAAGGWCDYGPAAAELQQR